MFFLDNISTQQHIKKSVITHLWKSYTSKYKFLILLGIQLLHTKYNYNDDNKKISQSDRRNFFAAQEDFA